jgi:replicative superfamily II helicase
LFSSQAGVRVQNAFKIVYVAPMKALAAEVTAAFSHRLAPLGGSIGLILLTLL